MPKPRATHETSVSFRLCEGTKHSRENTYDPPRMCRDPRHTAKIAQKCSYSTDVNVELTVFTTQGYCQILSNLWSFEASNHCLQDYCNNLFLHPGLCPLSSCWATSPEVSTIPHNHSLQYSYTVMHPLCLDPIWRFPKLAVAPDHPILYDVPL